MVVMPMHFGDHRHQLSGFRVLDFFLFHLGLLEDASLCHQCTSHVTVGKQIHMERGTVVVGTFCLKFSH
jgi:hypothetical protein